MTATDGSSEVLTLRDEIRPGHRKLAGAGIGGLGITPVILWVWGMIDITLFPNTDLPMTPEVAAWLAPVISAVIFYFTKEDQVVRSIERPAATAMPVAGGVPGVGVRDTGRVFSDPAA